MSGWQEKRLGEVLKKRVERGVPGLPIVSVTMQGLKPRSELDRRTESNLPEEAHLTARKNDLVYNTMRMWQGVAGLVDIDCLVSPAYVVCQPTEDICPRFFSYLFKYGPTIKKFENNAFGLTADRLRLYYDDFARIKIMIPPLKEQKKIAEILSTWDRAIEASQEKERRAIKQLEAIRSRIFQQTEGTKKLRLGDLVVFNYGKSPKDIISESGEYPIIGTGGVTGRTNEYLCADGGIVVGRKGTIDKPQLISSSFWPIDTTYYITKSEKYDLAWVYHQLFALKLKQYNEASGVPSLNRETIGDLDVHLPPLAMQKIVGETLNEVQKSAEAQNLLTASLIKQKQGLMQKLLTGKVRVKV